MKELKLKSSQSKLSLRLMTSSPEQGSDWLSLTLGAVLFGQRCVWLGDLIPPRPWDTATEASLQTFSEDKACRFFLFSTEFKPRDKRTAGGPQPITPPLSAWTAAELPNSHGGEKVHFGY